MVRTAPSGRLAVETTLRRRTRLSCRLAPPRSATTPLLEGQALEGGLDAQPRLVARAQHLHLDALVVRRGASSRSRLRASRTAEVATATMRGPWPFGE